MQILLEEVCQHLRNWFVSADKGDVYSGSFRVTDGEITGEGQTKTPDINSGDYFRIIGSRQNDGVYIAGTDTPQDDYFNGQVWILRPSAAFLALVKDIGDWQEQNGAADSANMSPFASESFGGYSYSKGSAGANGGTAMTWQRQFASRLNAWRKI